MTNPDDTKAFFSQGIEKNLDALYGTALRLTGSGADAEDLVAESVSKAWAAIGTLQDRRRFRAWIFRILNNCFVSNYRKASLGATIMAAIEQLPEAFRTTILLINVEGLTYDEAAEALGVPSGTIRSRMKRGRTLLQKALWQQATDAGFAPTSQAGNKL
jgi:RNA polymerase sigma-70 factor (ECF subfamily)